MRALDITAREMSVYLGGEQTPLRFDHRAMQQAEIYFEYSAGPQNSLGYIAILIRAQRRMYTALAAVAYGAYASALMAKGERIPPSPADFDRCVDLAQLLAISEDLMREATQALPQAGGSAKNADGQARPGSSSGDN